MKVKRYLTYTLAGVFLTAGQALAAPQINGVNGEVGHNQEISITGSGFGAKNQAAPVKWDDFESGTEGADVSGWYTTTNKAGLGPKYSVKARKSGVAEKTARQKFGSVDGSAIYNCTLGLTNQDIGKLYLSGWFYNTTSGAGSRNFKIFSLRGGSPGKWDAPEARADMYPSLGSGHIYTEGSSNNVLLDSWGLGGNLHSGAWHRFEVWIDDDNGGNNGNYTIWLDGKRWASISGRIKDNTSPYTNIYLAAYFAVDKGSPTPGLEFHWDELYVDNTLARIEIGDSPDWLTVKHKEIQVPLEWSDGSINFSFKQGSFNVGDPVYLYIVDRNGDVNEKGYPLVIGKAGAGAGAGAGTTAPGLTPPTIQLIR